MTLSTRSGEPVRLRDQGWHDATTTTTTTATATATATATTTTNNDNDNDNNIVNGTIHADVRVRSMRSVCAPQCAPHDESQHGGMP